MDKRKKWSDIFKSDHQHLLDVKSKKTDAKTEDERLVESFKEINHFCDTNKRLPDRDHDLHERNLASRLHGIRKNPEKVKKLIPYDTHGLLSGSLKKRKDVRSFDDIVASDDHGLLDNSGEDIFKLKHVPKKTSMPSYVARRKKCEDFENYKHLFIECHREIQDEKRSLLPFRNEQQIERGLFFVLKGVLLYIADVGKRKNVKGKYNARLRCVFENGTESDMLLRSLAAELYKHGRRVTPSVDRLFESFGDIDENKDTLTGYIYIVRSLSQKKEIQQIDNLFKIGFSRKLPEKRISNAENEPTFLMAPVKLVISYECYNFNPQSMEKRLHKFFGNACLDVDVYGENRKKYSPREWFVAPIEIIEKAVLFLLNGEIENYHYDNQTNEILNRE